MVNIVKWEKLKAKVLYLNRFIYSSLRFFGYDLPIPREMYTVFPIYLFKRVQKTKDGEYYLGFEYRGTYVKPVIASILSGVLEEEKIIRVPISEEGESKVMLMITDNEYEFYENELDAIKNKLIESFKKVRRARMMFLITTLENQWKFLHKG